MNVGLLKFIARKLKLAAGGEGKEYEEVWDEEDSEVEETNCNEFGGEELTVSKDQQKV